MLAGLSIMAFITSLDLIIFRTQNPFVRYRFWLLAGGAFAPLLLIFVYSRRRTIFKEFRLKQIFELYLASLGQWLGALIVFLSVGYLMGVKLNIGDIYPMFVIATGLGMLTMVPGGAGTFDVDFGFGASRVESKYSGRLDLVLSNILLPSSFYNGYHNFFD